MLMGLNNNAHIVPVKYSHLGTPQNGTYWGKKRCIGKDTGTRPTLIKKKKCHGSFKANAQGRSDFTFLIFLS